MTRFKLISFPLCPYVQRAAIALAEKGVPFERIDIDLANKPDWFLALSPLGKVPLLVVTLDDGREEVLFESLVIAEYLDETIAPPLHPADPLERARHRAWIEFASATLADFVGFYGGDEATFHTRLGAIDAKFARLEALLGDGPFFAGEHFTLVDAAFAPVLRYFDAFDALADHGLFDGRPKLRAWREALAARPSVRGAAPADYAERLLRFIAAKNGHLARLTTEPLAA
ncbi:MAG TPA: glutathione S-transferase family protein [Allosphingosinicella sp.]|nr:glutathione S-transferase family protein [Allosphingosinicella sp.]